MKVRKIILLIACLCFLGCAPAISKPLREQTIPQKMHLWEKEDPYWGPRYYLGWGYYYAPYYWCRHPYYRDWPPWNPYWW